MMGMMILYGPKTSAAWFKSITIRSVQEIQIQIQEEICEILLPDTEAELLRRTLPTSPDFGFVERPRGWKKNVTYLGPKNDTSSRNYIT